METLLYLHELAFCAGVAVGLVFVLLVVIASRCGR